MAHALRAELEDTFATSVLLACASEPRAPPTPAAAVKYSDEFEYTVTEVVNEDADSTSGRCGRRAWVDKGTNHHQCLCVMP